MFHARRAIRKLNEWKPRSKQDKRRKEMAIGIATKYIEVDTDWPWATKICDVTQRIVGFCFDWSLYIEKHGFPWSDSYVRENFLSSKAQKKQVKLTPNFLAKLIMDAYKTLWDAGFTRFCEPSIARMQIITIDKLQELLGNAFSPRMAKQLLNTLSHLKAAHFTLTGKKGQWQCVAKFDGDEIVYKDYKDDSKQYYIPLHDDSTPGAIAKLYEHYEFKPATE